MAISILSEFSYAGTYTSTIISPFNNPILYFKVSGAGSITSPTAEIDIVGTVETITMEACFEKTLSTEHYFFVDLSAVLKYVLRRFDGIEYPDDLEFINGNTIDRIDAYMRQITITVYFEKGTGDEQTATINPFLAYLSNNSPSVTGFNLINMQNLSGTDYLKWGIDTYNSLFMIAYADVKINVNGTDVYDASIGTMYGYYQYKFDKATMPMVSGINTIIVTTVYGSKTFIIDYDPACTTKHSLCWQHPQHGYVSYPFEGAMITETNVGRGIEIEKVLTSMVNASQLNEQLGYKKSKTITLRAKVEKKYWPLFEDLYNSRHVYLFTGTSGVNDTLASWMECRVTGGYSDNDTRNAKIFTVELQSAAQFPISF